MSSSFTIVYQLKKKDFLEALLTSTTDYERMCELRDRFLSRAMLESIEVSELTQAKQHYCVNRYILIRKNNSKKLVQ